MNESPHRRSTRALWIAWAVVLVAACVVAWPRTPHAVGADDPDLETRTLMSAFDGDVDIYFQEDTVKGRQPTLEGMKLARAETILGKRFLRVRAPGGGYWLINPERVAAFRVKPRGPQP